MWYHVISWHRIVEVFFFDILLPTFLATTIVGMAALLWQMFVKGDD